ncbi:hypothetical protein [Thalassolituus sp.]|jgi:hypothetical protein|uniref:hypothetical protein n=1 Tax=Thalassolituus sp. TaxID=2030822 RepID=UPI0035148F3F|nr:MAG: hypothetical protein CSH36_15520 [Thalassolituus sp.]
MPIVYSEKEASLQEVVTIQEVDDLLEWLLANTDASIDLAECRHLHLAALQTLASARRKVSAWPQDEAFKGWIKPLLTTGE